MDKESIYLLQELDCNCSDCKFMVRDFTKFKDSSAFHHALCLNEFEKQKAKILVDADYWYKRQEFDKGLVLETHGNKMKFQFSEKEECPINYGHCQKLDKPVSFIPGTCQLETQDCFEHRKKILLNRDGYH